MALRAATEWSMMAIINTTTTITRPATAAGYPAVPLAENAHEEGPALVDDLAADLLGILLASLGTKQIAVVIHAKTPWSGGRRINVERQRPGDSARSKNGRLMRQPTHSAHHCRSDTEARDQTERAGDYRLPYSM